MNITEIIDFPDYKVCSLTLRVFDDLFIEKKIIMFYPEEDFFFFISIIKDFERFRMGKTTTIEKIWLKHMTMLRKDMATKKEETKFRRKFKIKIPDVSAHTEHKVSKVRIIKDMI